VPEYTVIGIREETPREAAQREWFEKQVLSAPDNLEAAARQLITLATALLSVLFGVLAVTNDPLPRYLALPLVRAIGIGVVLLLLLSVCAALLVVYPRRWEAASGKPESQENVFGRLLHWKGRALAVGAIAFAAGVTGLGAVLVMALLYA
jgi:hypothetical protein